MNKIILILTFVTIFAISATCFYISNVCKANNIVEELSKEIDNDIIEFQRDEFSEVLYEEDTIFGDEITGDGIDESGEELIEEEFNLAKEENTKINSTSNLKTESNNSSSNNQTQVKTASQKYNMPYYIKINRTQNVVNVYTKDASGDYTVPFKAMVCSTGTSTPKAGTKYKITSYRREWNGLKGGVYGQYAVQIVGNILFHSVPYTAKDKSTLEYWEYDKLGTKASLGCIRLAVKDVKWIYDNVGAGTIVEFYEDDNPGPLGKPTAQIISDNEECRGWDPTDYVEGNPWLASSIEENSEDSEEYTEENDYIELENELQNSNTEILIASGEIDLEKENDVPENIVVDTKEDETTEQDQEYSGENIIEFIEPTEELNNSEFLDELTNIEEYKTSGD